MDTRIWIGALVGALATLVIVGGVVVVRAATGPMGMMGGGMMGGMMGGDMDAMHEKCRQMMEEHEDDGSEDPGNTTAMPASAAASRLPVLPLALT